MINLKEELGIQSYCFRGFKNHSAVIAALKDCGVSAVELCRAHIDFHDEARFPEIIDQYSGAGIRIVSIGVETFAEDLEYEKRLFEFLELAGARYMSVDFKPGSSPESWRRAGEWAEKHDVFLCIHNHGGRHWLGSAQMLAHVLANTSHRIGLCLDTAWAQDAGEDPLLMAETFADRLYGVHLKDFVFDRARQPQDAVVGEGNLNLDRFLELLEGCDSLGYAVLEYEGDVDNPVPALRKCVRALRRIV